MRTKEDIMEAVNRYKPESCHIRVEHVNAIIEALIDIRDELEKQYKLDED